jgi:hypothetical protein
MEENEKLEINDLLKNSQSNNSNSSNEIEYYSDYDNYLLYSATENEQITHKLYNVENNTSPPHYV